MRLNLASHQSFRGDGDLLYGGKHSDVSEMLLVKAQELITNGEFGIATVVAHTACEISAERAISQAFAAKGIAYLEDWADKVPEFKTSTMLCWGTKFRANLSGQISRNRRSADMASFTREKP
jgi:hypothetical protein